MLKCLLVVLLLNLGLVSIVKCVWFVCVSCYVYDSLVVLVLRIVIFVLIVLDGVGSVVWLCSVWFLCMLG